MSESKETKWCSAGKFWTCKFLRNFKQARAMERKERKKIGGLMKARY